MYIYCDLCTHTHTHTHTQTRTNEHTNIHMCVCAHVHLGIFMRDVHVLVQVCVDICGCVYMDYHALVHTWFNSNDYGTATYSNQRTHCIFSSSSSSMCSWYTDKTGPHLCEKLPHTGKFWWGKIGEYNESWVIRHANIHRYTENVFGICSCL